MNRKQKGMKSIMEDKILPYILMLPTLLGVVVFSFYPFLKTFISSFSLTTEYGEWIKWAGTYFWKELFLGQEGRFLQILKTTLIFAAMNFSMVFIGAMVLALLCVKKDKYSKLFQTAFALPMAISSVIASVMFRFIFDGNGGLMNSWLGTEIAWLKNESTAIWVVAIVTAWSHIGSEFLLLLAGFRSVSEDIQEAATVDGANAFTKAVKIMIPMASPQIFYVLFVSIITAFKTFTQIKLLTGGGPLDSTMTFMMDIYQQGYEVGEYEYACCASIVLFLIIFIVTRIQFMFEKKMVHYQ